MYVVVTYDISHDRRRNQVAKCMEDYGTRVQYSVFDCLLDEQGILEVQKKLQQIIDMEVDSIRFYRLCKKCNRIIEVLGRGIIREEQDVIIV